MGYICAVGAFSFWGMIPLYWREMAGHSSLELIGHRVLWGSVSLLLYLRFYKQGSLYDLVRMGLKKENRWLLLSSFLIGINWFIFMYAVMQDKVVEASLGYFLNPLINVLLGLLIFKEKVSRLKWFSIFLAFIGLIIFSMGKLSEPAISLSLAFSFAFYGVLHKKSKIDPIEGLFLETSLVSLFLMPYLLHSGHFSLSFLRSGGSDAVWLISAGPVTIIPLLLFTFAVKKIPLSSVGIIQYIAPLGQLALGVSVFGQELEAQSIAAFCLIWLALGLFTFGELVVLKRKNNKKGELSS